MSTNLFRQWDAPVAHNAEKAAREVLALWGDDPSGYGYCELAQHILDLLERSGTCPTCGSWCGKGYGCEWCSEFAQESGWNDA